MLVFLKRGTEIKKVIILSFTLLLAAGGAANSATTTVSCQVSAGIDDGFAQSAAVQDITATFLKIGDENTYAVPYQMSGMRFVSVNIPRSATIINAYLKISSINTDYRGQLYGLIAAEASDNPADFGGRSIGDAALTTETVVWDFKDAWSPDTQYVSPDISNTIQEVVNRPGFSNGNSIAIYYSTREPSNKARSFASYEYSPSSAAVLEVTYETYTISGQILTTEAAPLEGVAVSAGADIEGDVTDGSGYYEIKVPIGWSGTVTPSKADWGFSPASQLYSNVTSNQINQDYTVFQPVISGYVKDDGGSGIEGVSVSSDNGGGSDTTDVTGYYEIIVPYNWSGAVTANKTGWNLTPPSRSYSNVTSNQVNQDFTGFQPIISGYVEDSNGTGVEGVSVSADNGGGSDTTDSNGYYEITVPYDWSGTVTISKHLWGFSPESREYNNITTDLANENYTGFLPPIISGCVADTNGYPIEGVWVSATNGGGGDTTGPDGNYALVVPYNWSGTIKPNAFGLIFSPTQRSYDNVITDEPNQDYITGSAVQIFVDTSATGNNNGSSWADAYIYLQDALAAATGSSCNEILVAQGVYKPDQGAGITAGSRGASFHLINDVAIYGGFPSGGGSWEEHNPADCETVLSGDIEGDNSYHVVTGSGTDNTALLNGFTITAGNANGSFYSEEAKGGGLFCLDGVATIINCIFKNNYARRDGGGIALWGAAGIKLINCTFIENRAQWGGAFMGQGTLVDCIFIRNSTTYDGYGGAIMLACNATLLNCIFLDNSSQEDGGAIYHSACGSPKIINCLFSGNSAEGEGGGMCSWWTPKLYNCTFSGNTAARGGGMRSINHPSTLTNCVLWGNTDNGGMDQSAQIDASTPPVVNYCCIMGWQGGGKGNIAADPLFLDADGYDDVYGTEDDLVLLLPGSSCIDAGDNDSVPSDTLDIDLDGYTIEPIPFDLSGSNRFIDDPNTPDTGNGIAPIADIGAYEYNGPVPYITVSVATIEFTALKDGPNPEPQTIFVSNSGNGILNWAIASDCNWLEVTPNSGSSSGEVNEVTLNVNTAGLIWGDYTCELTITDPCAYNNPQTFEVILSMTGPLISVNPGTLEFSAIQNDSNVPGQTIEISNVGEWFLDWSISCDCDWIYIDPNSGISIGEANEATVYINRTDMRGGNYECQLTISDAHAENSPQTVEVSLELLGPLISAQPTSLQFQASKDNPNPLNQSIAIQNVGYATLYWAIAIPDDCTWLSVDPNSGTSTSESDTVTLTVNASGLEYGLYSCQLIISDLNAQNSPQVVTVNLEVLRPVLFVVPGNIDFVGEKDGVDPNTQILSIQNTGYDTLNWQIDIPASCGWLSVAPLMGQSTGEVDEAILSVDGTGLDYGFYDCELVISAPDAENNPQIVPVNLHVYIEGEKHVPAEYEDIQAAIDAAVEGDEVIIQPGTYTGPGNYNIDFLGKAITVLSIEPENPAIVAATIVDPNYYGTGFVFLSGEDANSVLDGLTITEGVSAVGGGICCRYSSPTIRNCIIRDCFALSHGGGIGLEDSNSKISNCIVTGNLTSEVGGGIACVWAGNPAITNCIITGNIVGWAGGGIGGCYCDITVRNCTLSGNKAESDFGGGGALCLWGATAEINNTILWGNDADDGAEIAMFDSEQPSQPSTVTVSYSDVEGGQSAVYVDPCSTLNWGEGNIDIDPCFAQPGYWHPNDTPLDANDDFWVDGDYHLRSEAGRWEWSKYIGLDTDGDGFIDLSDFAAFANLWQTEGGNIAADLDGSGSVDLSDLELLVNNYLADYPVGEWTADDVTSACIDAGDPNSDWTGELWPHGERINMGAYGGTAQASMSLSTAGNKADLDRDGDVDGDDLALLAGMWLVEDVLLSEDINRNGSVNFSDFAEFGWQWRWEE